MMTAAERLGPTGRRKKCTVLKASETVCNDARAVSQCFWGLRYYDCSKSRNEFILYVTLRVRHLMLRTAIHEHTRRYKRRTLCDIFLFLFFFRSPNDRFKQTYKYFCTLRHDDTVTRAGIFEGWVDQDELKLNWITFRCCYEWFRLNFTDFYISIMCET
jgi:hypothetical protein